MPHYSMEEILLRYPQCLRANIREVVVNGIGLTNARIQLNLPPSKAGMNYEVEHGNSVILDVPYVGKHLKWEIIFNDEDPTFAPDIDILNDSFLDDPDVDLIETHLPALCEWDIENPRSLVTLIEQLYRLYKAEQMDKLLNGAKHILLQRELVQLKAQMVLNNDDIEVFIEDSGQHFWIPLQLDFLDLPVYIRKNYFSDGIVMNPGVDKITLKVSFYLHRKVCALQLSPRLEDLFGTYTSLQIPSYKNSSSMVEYVESVKNLLQEHLHHIKKNFEKKENYVSTLLSLHGDNVREYDNIGFTKVTVLFEIGSFACLGYISLSEQFPNEMPLVTLQSMYHKNASGTPAYLVLKSYPYSSEWKVEEMVDKLLKHIRNEMNRFKMHCVNNLSQ